MMRQMYQTKQTSKSVFSTIRGLNYHLLEWGQPVPGQPTLFMLHGWMDVADSFQFMVDAFDRPFHILAPDWRGYGLSESGNVDNFWFPDYMADLDALLNHFAAHGPIDLLGHSMGGNVAMMYAGVRPNRIRRLINLEGFGMAPTDPSQAPHRYAQWMDALLKFRDGAMALKTYPSAQAVADRLQLNNPRMSHDQAQWLALRWARPNALGQWEIQGHPAHKVINAQLYRVDEAVEIFSRITAPTLCVVASDDSMTRWWKDAYTLEMFYQRIAVVPNLKHAKIENAGHMMHHDQPKALAHWVQNFLAD